MMPKYLPPLSSGASIRPSRGGISHSEHEYTSPDELGMGIERLTELLYELGYVYREEQTS